MQISLKLSRDHFEVPPPVPEDHRVVRDRSQSGWRVMVSDDTKVVQGAVTLQVQMGRSPMFGHRFKQHSKHHRRKPMRNVPHLPDVFELSTSQGCMGQKDSLDTPAESSEAPTSQEQPAKSVTFGGLEFPLSGGRDNDRHWLG